MQGSCLQLRNGTGNSVLGGRRQAQRHALGRREHSSIAPYRDVSTMEAASEEPKGKRRRKKAAGSCMFLRCRDTVCCAVLFRVESMHSFDSGKSCLPVTG